MKITETEVRYVADLANLELAPEELHRLAREMDGILEYIAKLNELDTASVEPMAQVLFEAEETATLRADREHQPLGSARATAAAPAAANGYFKVPKVIER